MSSLITRKGYSLVSPTPDQTTAPGGNALNANFTQVGDDVEALNASLATKVSQTQLDAVSTYAAAVDSGLSAHVADTSNPHHTTAAQVGALPLSGGSVSGSLEVSGVVSFLATNSWFPYGDGNNYIRGTTIFGFPEIARFDNGTGRFGIKTTTPGTDLEVKGQVAATTSGGFVQLWSDNAIIFKSGNSNGGLRFGKATGLGAEGYAEVFKIKDSGSIVANVDYTNYESIATTASLAEIASWASSATNKIDKNTGVSAGVLAQWDGYGGIQDSMVQTSVVWTVPGSYTPGNIVVFTSDGKPQDSGVSPGGFSGGGGTPPLSTVLSVGSDAGGYGISGLTSLTLNGYSISSWSDLSAYVSGSTPTLSTVLSTGNDAGTYDITNVGTLSCSAINPGTYQSGGYAGVSGTFTTPTGLLVTVTNGIITNIAE